MVTKEYIDVVVKVAIEVGDKIGRPDVLCWFPLYLKRNAIHRPIILARCLQVAYVELGGAWMEAQGLLKVCEGFTKILTLLG